MLNRFLNHIHSRPELLILVLVITIIAMLIIPLPDIRRFIKSLIQHRFRDLEVLSFGELTDSVTVNVIKTI